MNPRSITSTEFTSIESVGHFLTQFEFNLEPRKIFLSFIFIYLEGTVEEQEGGRNLPSTDLFPKWPDQLGLGQIVARSQ